MSEDENGRSQSQPCAETGTHIPSSPDPLSVLEQAAKICEQEAVAFLSPNYATNQPRSSFSERFACSECARSIREYAGRVALVMSLDGAAASPTGGQLGPGTSPDTSWNKRASPPGGEWQGIDTASQSQPSADGESAARTASEPSGEEFLEFKEALDDVRSLRAEHRDLNGGGPGWSARNEAAWARVSELFANEDEAAWCRQQEDAHG